MMKIMFISPHPGFGGASTANQAIAYMLSKEGNEVIYVDEYCKSFLYDTFSCSRFPIHKNRFTKHFNTYKYILRESPDYILIGIPYIGIYYLAFLLYLRYVKKIKIGYIFHSLSLANSLKGRVWERIMSFSTICATDLFYVSKHTLISWNKFLTIRFLHTRKHIVYNAIVKREEIKKEKTACNNVAFVGRLSEEKRPEIFCEIAKHYPQKKFFLWGNGPLYDSLKEKYQSYVTFKGYTNDISEIYSNMDLLCVCSTIENCPMCILEARGYGIPCISTKVGGIPEILQEGINGEFFEGNNPVFSFALAMEKIEKRYKEYVKACYETSKDYSLDMIGKRWNVIINK